MKRNDLVRSLRKQLSGIIFEIKRIGPKRVSLEIIKPIPDEDGFVVKYFPTGRLEAIHIYKKRVMTRDYFDKKFRRVVNKFRL